MKKSILKKAKERLSIPICAIGGISSDNIDEITQLNPDMVAVISAVFDGNISENIKRLGV